MAAVAEHLTRCTDEHATRGGRDAAEVVGAALLDAGRPRDATLVSVLAHAGVRSGEALALGHARVRTLLVDDAVCLERPAPMCRTRAPA